MSDDGDLVGVFVMKGSTFGVDELTLSFGPDGALTGNLRPVLGWELWPLWLRVAQEHFVAARTARTSLQAADSDGEERADLLRSETQAGMVAISAVAFAIEAMSISAARLAGLRGGKARRI
jgi:hypothetical protein